MCLIFFIAAVILYKLAYNTFKCRETHNVFDDFKSKNILYGELIWNFVEFSTGEDSNVLRRVYGNRKGLFTRERQPKSAAFVIKQRYEKLKNN